MSDTIVDPPPRPTVNDEAALRPKPRSRRGRFAVVAVASLLTLAGIAALLYVLLIRYESVARRHIPGNANLVARVDAVDIALFGPVRKHLWPLVFEHPFSGAAPPKKAPARAERIREETGINLATDIRELVIASVDATSWVMVVGGRIPKGRFVSGMEAIARKDGWSGWRREGALFLGPGVVLAQAEDGTIVVGTDADIVNASLPATDEWKRMGLPEEGAVTFVMTDDAWSGAASKVDQIVPGGGGNLRRIGGVTGRMTLGKSPSINARLLPQAGQDAAAIAADLERALGGLRVLLLLAPDVAGEKDAIAATKVATEGGVVKVDVPWPYEGLDRACSRLAQYLRESLARGG